MGFSSQVKNVQSGKFGPDKPNIPQQPQPTSANGKGGGAVAAPQGQQGVITNSATSGQPQMGSPNQYPNTVQMRDNDINPMTFGGGRYAGQGGKGKGA